MKERPIIMTGESVRDTLDDRKTITRRIVKGVPPEFLTPDIALLSNGLGRYAFSREVVPGRCEAWPPDPLPGLKCPYGVPGDRLWVKETWMETADPVDLQPTGKYLYRATHEGEEPRKVDGDGFTLWRKDGLQASPWQSPLFMPREVSRILVEIVSVRVERLQDITPADITAEGVLTLGEQMWGSRWWVGAPEKAIADARALFAKRWDAIHGPGAWDRNDWVWPIEYRRVGA